MQPRARPCATSATSALPASPPATDALTLSAPMQRPMPPAPCHPPRRWLHPPSHRCNAWSCVRRSSAASSACASASACTARSRCSSSATPACSCTAHPCSEKVNTGHEDTAGWAASLAAPASDALTVPTAAAAAAWGSAPGGHAAAAAASCCCCCSDCCAPCTPRPPPASACVRAVAAEPRPCTTAPHLASSAVGACGRPMRAAMGSVSASASACTRSASAPTASASALTSSSCLAAVFECAPDSFAAAVRPAEITIGTRCTCGPIGPLNTSPGRAPGCSRDSGWGASTARAPAGLAPAASAAATPATASAVAAAGASRAAVRAAPASPLPSGRLRAAAQMAGIARSRSSHIWLAAGARASAKRADTVAGSSAPHAAFTRSRACCGCHTYGHVGSSSTRSDVPGSTGSGRAASPVSVHAS
eukprot:140233-Chlamydomonas_euryale.AAC.2